MCELCSTPTKNDSPTHELSVPYFGAETCEEHLKFCANFDEVCKGQNVTAGPGQCALARCSITGDALNVHNNHADVLPSKTVDHCKECLDAVHASIFPCCVAAVQKNSACVGS